MPLQDTEGLVAEFAQLGKPSVGEGALDTGRHAERLSRNLRPAYSKRFAGNGTDPGLVSDTKKDYIDEGHLLSPIQ